MIALVLYSLVNTPLQVCFADSYVVPSFIYIFNAFVDFCFLFDVPLNFRTAFYEQKMLSPCLDYEKIARHYVFGERGWGGWFCPDLFAAIPFDWIPNQSAHNSTWLSFAKIGRLFRLSRVAKKFDQLTSIHAVRVGNFLVLLLLCTHMMACVWWSVGWSVSNDRGWQFESKVATVLLEADVFELDDPLLTEASVHGDLAFNSTRLRERLDQVPLQKKYLTSLYWALTMVMKSPWLSPSIASEQIYASFTVIIGAMLFAAFIGNFTTAIASYDKSNAVYRDSITTLRSFFKLRPAISSQMRKRIVRYAEAYFKQTIEGIDERMVLESLPEHLRPVVLLELHYELVHSSSWLQELSFACCSDFLLALKPEVLLAGDVLLRAGVLCDRFYVLQSGDLQVTFPPDGACVSKLSLILGEGRVAIAKGSMMQRNSTRIPQGRIMRIGSLVGWSAPHAESRPLAYQVRASLDSSLLSIRRHELATILDKHPLDAHVFKAAVDHASKLINPVKRSTFAPSVSNCSATSRIRASESSKHLELADQSFSSSGSVPVEVELKADRRCSTTEMMRSNATCDCTVSNGPLTKRKVSSNSIFGKGGTNVRSDMQYESRDGFFEAVSSGWLRSPGAQTVSPPSAVTFGTARCEDAASAVSGFATDGVSAQLIEELASIKDKIIELETAVSKTAEESNALRKQLGCKASGAGGLSW